MREKSDATPKDKEQKYHAQAQDDECEEWRDLWSHAFKELLANSISRFLLYQP